MEFVYKIHASVILDIMDCYVIAVFLILVIGSNPNSIFTPREKHSVAYDSQNDKAYISFGFSWPNIVLSDFLVYDFPTKAIFAIGKSNWKTSPLGRYDHKTWIWNSKLVLYGGRTNTAQFVDVWVYDIGIFVFIKLLIHGAFSIPIHLKQ
jgi:hypothetical protein